ncbi:hypothetical protein HYQ46_006539 [Verticillium longisporum]|nr:hypothetical protein HYQ46_006539 [Verticillium longisporum]
MIAMGWTLVALGSAGSQRSKKGKLDKKQTGRGFLELAYKAVRIGKLRLQPRPSYHCPLPTAHCPHERPESKQSI